MPQFEWPGVLWALLALPLLMMGKRRAQAPPAVRLTRVAELALLPRSARQRWAGQGKGGMTDVLRVAALVLLLCALAGPRWNGSRVREISKSIGIQVVVDCSGSMNETDMLLEGKRRSRIDLVRELSKKFVLGDGGGLKGRMEDVIGVIAFADYPTTLCPLMLPDRNMRQILERIRVADGPAAEGTAIGDAVAAAAARFHIAETTAAGRFRSKAIVLLTDGENNSGKRSVAEAAALARQWGVRIYAIRIRPGGRQPSGVDPAWNDLELLAAASEGMARLATDGASLETVYQEIDKLERSDRPARLSGGWELIYALAGAGLGLVIAEIVLTQTWLRRIP